MSLSNKKIKVAIAVSGGVDSSVAAALLKEQGYDVFGVFMHFWSEKIEGSVRDNICCSIESQEDARRVCQKLQIPFYTLNFEEPFKEKIVDDFIDQYQNCETPNPCVLCNKYIKFDYLWKKVSAMGAEFVATGHYARVRKPRWWSSDKTYKLLKGVDATKDQSYFLHQVNQEQLKHMLFPVGGLKKTEVRRLAAKYGLPTASKKESQEICFIPDGNVENFLGRYLKLQPGKIKNIYNNEVLGEHKGLPLYTIGQRKGMGLGAGPWYVVRLDKEHNVLWVSTDEDKIASNNLKIKEVNWIAGSIPELPLKVKCRIRYCSHEVGATINQKDSIYQVQFDEPQRAITPGQYCVFWRGKECLGGGKIVG